MPSGAKAALQGYRLQTLYTLALILREGDGQTTFHPEGAEDLGVSTPGTPPHSIQVKAYSQPLVLSDFEPNKKGSFLRRAAAILTRGAGTVEVISFGPIGPELKQAWNAAGEARDDVRRKLVQLGYANSDVDVLLDRLRFTGVAERDLADGVYRFLRDSLAGGDPDVAFDLLTAWLFVAAENQRTITYRDLVDKLSAVGRYLAERAAHHREWFTSIVPILDEAPDEEAKPMLKSAYYQGVAARYDHILAGLDVPRPQLLDKIDAAFRDGGRVCVVHGASGQGKSTVAFRYLRDYVPEHWRFAIVGLRDGEHASSVALAVAEHLRVVDAPTYVYIDVNSRDGDWTRLVTRLLDAPKLRILVTIRNEDLARRSVTDAELGLPRAVAVELDQDGARMIFERLAQDGLVVFPSFGEAWERFGGEGPLLEFVHLVTQTETLRDRLKGQVRRLRDDVRRGALLPQKVQFLFYCAVANAYEARAELRMLSQQLGLPDPIRTLELLENEYLLRRSEDGRFAEALHPIRSRILAEELEDPALAPWIDAVGIVYPHIPETDIQSFLLYCFSRRPEFAADLTGMIHRRHVRTWRGLRGILKSLLWLGVNEYVRANKELIAEQRAISGSGWFLVLKGDIADAIPGAVDGILALLGPDGLERVQAARERQTSPEDIFTRLDAWLRIEMPWPEPPRGDADWLALAECCFWSFRRGIVTSFAAAASAELPVPLQRLDALPGLAVTAQTYTYNGWDGSLATSSDHGTTATFHYEGSGRLHDWAVGSAFGETLGYDDDDQLAFRTNPVFSEYFGPRDPRGKVLSVSTSIQRDQTLSGQYFMGYSSLGTLAGFVKNRGVGTTDIYTTDGLGNVVSRDATSGSSLDHRVYTSAFLNAERLDTTGVTAPDALADGATRPRLSSTSYVYDASGNQIGTAVTPRRPVTGTAQYEITHEGASWTRSYYDGANRLALYQESGFQQVGTGYPRRTTVSEYRYDPLGRRILARMVRDTACVTRDGSPGASCPEIRDQVATIDRFVWEGDQLLYEFRGEGGYFASKTTLQVGEINPTTAAFQGNVHYFHAGGIDHPLALWKDNETSGFVPHLSWRGAYEQLSKLDDNTDPHIYLAASDQDAYHGSDVRTSTLQENRWLGSIISQPANGAGVVYMRNRYYDPKSGRFTQEDPIGLAGGKNLYAFAGGDPVNYTDPFGLCPQCFERAAEVVEEEGPALEAETLRLGQAASQAASAYGQRFTSFYGNLAQTVGSRLSNLVGHVTEREHLSTTALESREKLTVFKSTGEAFDHVGETLEKINGVRNLLPRIQSALSDPRMQGELRDQFQALMSKASKALDAMEQAIKK